MINSFVSNIKRKKVHPTKMNLHKHTFLVTFQWKPQENIMAVMGGEILRNGKYSNVCVQNLKIWIEQIVPL